MNRLLALGAVLAMLAACSEEPQPPPPPPPPPPGLSLEASTLTASPASVVADGTATAAVIVTVMGKDGKPLAGQKVVVSATGEGNVLAPAEAESGDDGIAAFKLASSRVGVKTVSATIAGQPLPATATVAFVPGAASRLGFRVPPSNVAAGEAITPEVVVEILDAAGNLVTEGAPQISIALGANPANATLAGTLAASAANGVATFADLSLDKAGAGVTLVASSEGLEPVTSDAFDVTAGPPSRLVFKVEPSAVVAGANVSPAIEVAFQDAQGNQVIDSTAEVSLAIATGPAGATLDGTAKGNAVQGVAKFGDISFDKAGEYTLAATANGFAGVTSASFSVHAAAASAVAVLTGPSNVEVRTPFTLEAAIVDAFGNRITDATDELTVTLIGGTGLAGTTSAAAVAGVASFTGLSIEDEGAGLELEVAASNLAPGKSLPFTVIDTTAPAALTDVKVPTTTGTTVTVTWTEVGDDGMLGLAASYEVRYSTAAFDSATFSSATLATSGNPLPPGSTESVRISGLSAGTQYFVGVKVSDAVGNSGFGFASGSTTNCPVGYEGVLCDTCAEGYRESSPGVCEDYCTNNDPCNPAPDATCNGDVAVTWPGTRACTPTLDAPYFECQGPVEIDCSATGELCHAGACVADPCAGVQCPDIAPTCAADRTTLTTTANVCERQVDAGNLVGVCVAHPATTDCSSTGDVCHAGACVDARAAAAGELMVTEVHRAATSAATWFEVYNASSDLLNLAGLKVEGGSSFTLAANPPVLLAPGEYLVFGGSSDPAQNGGVAVDLSWESLAPTFALDGAQPLKLTAGSVAVESLDYATILPALPAGTAAALSSKVLAAGANQHGWYWCAATEVLSGGGKGSPGAANGDCGVTVTAPVDYCVLQHPTDAGTAGAPITVYGQLYEPSVTDRNPAGNDGYPHVVAELGYGPAIQSGTPDLDSWTWVAAKPNASYVDSDPVNDRDEYEAELAPSSAGTYLYGYRFSLRDPQTGALSTPTYCGRNGVVTSPTPADFGTITWNSAQRDIAAARATADGTGLNLPISGALVTYVRPAIGTEVAGFFVQAESQTGPALFIGVDPATLSPPPTKGSRVAFTITEMDTNGALRSAAAITGYSEESNGHSVATLAQEVSTKTDLLSALVDYESELITVTGTIAVPFASAGTGFVSAQLDTAGISGEANLKLRLPVTVRDQLRLDQGCTVTVTATPMWRFNAQAQVSAWDAADVSIQSCPGPKMVTAAATSPTSVVVTFDSELDAATLAANGSQFGILPVLAVSGATLGGGGKQVTLTTATQVGGTSYTVTVASSLKDLRGQSAVAPDNARPFTGVASGGACAPSQVVISQVYGGGGNGGAVFKHDFVELHNRSATQPASVGGWSVQYASATGTTWNNKVDIPAGTTIAPGGYFLIQLSSGGNVGADLPAPDLTGNINMAGANGKVLLASGTTSLSGGCPTSGVVDFVGFGTASCFEGAGGTQAPSNSTAVIRSGDGCLDTDENGADFVVAAPAPRNIASPPVSCGCN